MAANESSKFVIYAALVGDILVAAAKFVAAELSGSSSMLSEALHSVVETGNEVLLLYGYYRSRRRPDQRHPFGYGRELYFWSFVVSLLLFAFGAGASIYQGVRHIAASRPIENADLNYMVLAASFVFEGVSFWVAFKNFRKVKGPLGYLEAARRSKDPPSFMVLFANAAALIGVGVAALGIFAAERLRMPVFDGAASILIGAILGVTGLLLAYESKELLIGERAGQDIIDSILLLARNEPGVEGANGVLTVHLAPDQILAALSLEFDDDLRTPQIEASTVSLEKRIREKHPEVVSLFIKPQSPRTFERARAERLSHWVVDD